MSEVSELILSGGFGLINYWILRALDLLVFFDPLDKDEKKQFIVILGIVNFYIFNILSSIQCDRFNIKKSDLLAFILSLIIAIVLELVLGFIIKKIIDYRNKAKEENGGIQNYNINTLDRIYYEYKDVDLYTYIFDFHNNLIDHGYFIHLSTKEPEFNLSLRKSHGYSNLTTSHDEFINLLDEHNKRPLVYIDFKHQIKMYLFEN